MKNWATLLFALLVACRAHADTIVSLRIVLGFQEKSDERILTLYSLAHELSNQMDTSAFVYIEEGTELSLHTQRLEKAADFHYLKGYFQNNLSQYGSAFLSLTYASELYHQLQNWQMAGYADLIRAQLLFEAGERVAAEEVYRKVKVLFLAHGLDASLGYVHEHLGYLYEKSGDLESSLMEHLLALGIYSQQEQHELSAKENNAIANLFLTLERYPEAEISLREVDRSLEKVEFTSQQKAYKLFYSGLLSYHTGQQEEGLLAQKEAIDLAKKLALWQEDIYAMTAQYAGLLLASGKPEHAIAVLERDMPAEENHSSEAHLEGLDVLASAYENLGNLEAALQIERARQAGMVSSQNAQSQALVARRSAEVALAQKTLADRDTVAKNNAQQQYWVFIGIAAMILVLILVYAGWMRIRFYKRQAEQRATHWPELQRRMDALENTLSWLE